MVMVRGNGDKWCEYNDRGMGEEWKTRASSDHILYNIFYSQNYKEIIQNHCHVHH